MVKANARHALAPYIVYIAGIHVPVVSVSVVYSVWDIPRMQITMVPDLALDDLGEDDCVPVQLFFYDWDAPEGQRDWRLLESGILTSRSYSSYQGQRTVSFVVMSDIWLLDRIGMFATSSIANTIDNFTSGRPDPQTPSRADFLMPAALFYQGFTPGTGQPIRRPYDLFQNAMDYAVGTSPHPAQPSTPAAQTKSAASLYWLAPRLQMTGLLEQFIPCPGIEDRSDYVPFPALSSVQVDTSLQVARGATSSISDGDSIWAVIKALYAKLYYEIATIPAPPCHEYNYTEGRVIGPYTVGRVGRVGRYVTKPRTGFGAPPWCNVIWASQAQACSHEDQWHAEPTRMLLADTWLMKQLRADSTSAQQLYALQASTGWPPRFNAMLDESLGRDGRPANPSVSPHSTLVSVAEIYRGPQTTRQDLPTVLAVALSATAATFESQIPQGPDTDSPAQTLARLTAFYRELEESIRVGTTVLQGLETQLDDVLRVVGENSADVQRRRDEIDVLSTAINQTTALARYLRNQIRLLEEQVGTYGDVRALDRSYTGIRDFIKSASASLDVLRTQTGLGLEYPVDLETQLDAYAPQSDLLRQMRLMYAANIWAQNAYQHHGGSTSMTFCPYVTPGLPGLVFDRDNTSAPMMVYIVGVTHNLGLEEASTVVSYTYARSLSRMYKLGRTLPSDLVSAQIASWPAEPITPVREIMQTHAGAQNFYNRLFFSHNTSNDTYLDPDKVFEASVDGGPRRPGRDLTMAELESGHIQWHVTSGFSNMATDNQAAHARAWRPGTSLEQWRQILRASSPGSALTPPDEELDTSNVAPFPVEVWRYTVRPSYSEPQGDGGPAPTPALAQLRVNWPDRLRQYRKRVLGHRQTGPRDH